MRRFVIASVTALILGCTSVPPPRQPYVPPSATDALGFARQALDRGEPVEALAWLLRMQQESPEQNELKTQAAAQVGTVLENLLSESRYTEVLSLSRGLGSASVPVKVPPNLEVQRRLLGFLQEKGWGAAASSLILSMSTQPGVSAQEAAIWRDYLFAERNRGALAELMVRRTGMSATAEQKEWLERRLGASDWLQGTVTVLVNKGIKIQRGVGVPDIMIGSAFYIDRRGYLLTNYHVIESEVDPSYEGFSRLSILPANGRGERLPARVVGWDKNLDVALLKTEREAPYVFSLTSAPDVKQGDTVLALGSPAGLESTVTSGIVSALERPFLPLGAAIQVDAPVNPGNSGGPLVSPDGRVIGLVFAGAPDFQGLNFAVAIDYIVPILPQLYAGGEVKRTWMGFGVAETAAGMEVNYLYPEGPAEKAGLPLGSVIRSINGAAVTAPSEMHRLLSSTHAGNLAAIAWEKEGMAGTSYVVLQERSRNPLLDAVSVDLPGALAPHLLGMELELVGDPFWRNYRVTRTWANTAADQMNLSEGDPVTITSWDLNTEKEVLLVQLFAKRRLGGYLESSVQFGVPLMPFLFF